MFDTRLTPPQRRIRRRRGLTLLEAMMAASILLVIVIAVTSAVVAGQQHAYEAHQRIAGAIAGQALLGQLFAEDYDQLPSWDGFTEAVGSMLDLNGDPMPGTFNMIGRDVQVTTELKDFPTIGAKIRGRTIRVRAFNQDARILADLTHFRPEPQP